MAVTRAQMNALLRQLEGPVRKSFQSAIARVKGRANIAALERAIVAGDIDAVMTVAGVREGMWSGLTEQIRSAYAAGGVFAVSKKTRWLKKLGQEFNINNPRAESWLRNHSAELVTGNLVTEQRAAIQVILQEGMALGNNPRTTALNIVGRISRETGRRSGGVIGLTGPQARYVVNMSSDLENLDPRYFNRVLRDKRFDAVVSKSFEEGVPLPADVRAQIVARYEDRMLKHRGDTIGRTETLKAINASADEAMRQAVEEGLTPNSAVIRIWRHSYAPNEREGHRMMDGWERGMDEYFVNPLTNEPLMYPGDGPPSESINCRCWLEHKVDFAAVEQAA